jgi:hypothetical protein
MTRFIRVAKTIIHIPSLANVTMDTSCFGAPQLNLYYHVQAHKTIQYGWGQWELCEKDLIRIKQAMLLSEKALENMPFTEEVKKEELQVEMTETANKNS